MQRMKRNSWLILISIFLFSCGNESVSKKKEDNSTLKKETTEENLSLEKSVNDSIFKSGDIIFQTTLGNQSDLVSIATQSPFSHCGMIIQSDTNYFVLEANGQVKTTPLSDWKKQGKDERFVVMRFKDRNKYDSKDNADKARKTTQKFMGRPYDSKFLWGDDEIYCSELVWKFYKETIDVELCTPKKLSDFDLTNENVKAELVKRYGKNIPLDETIVAPSDIAASDKLEMIYSNY